MFSSRHPDTLKGLVDQLGPLARVGTVAEAVEFGDVVMVVVPYTAMDQIGKDYGNALAKKVLVIDVSNPIARRDGAEIVKWVDEKGCDLVAMGTHGHGLLADMFFGTTANRAATSSRGIGRARSLAAACMHFTIVDVESINVPSQSKTIRSNCFLAMSPDRFPPPAPSIKY